MIPRRNTGLCIALLEYDDIIADQRCVTSVDDTR